MLDQNANRGSVADTSRNILETALLTGAALAPLFCLPGCKDPSVSGNAEQDSQPINNTLLISEVHLTHAQRLSLERLPLLETPIYFFDPLRTIPIPQRDLLLQILNPSDDAFISFKIVPESWPPPIPPRRFGSLLGDLPPVTLELSIKDFLENDWHPVAIDGRVSEIIIRGNRNGVENESVSLHFQTADSLGQEIEVDTFGSGTFQMAVKPRLTFLRELGEESLNASLTLELSELGLENLSGFVYTREERPVSFLGGNNEYGLYSNMKHEFILEKIAPHQDQIGSGISTIESLFGRASGAQVTNVYIINDHYPNGYFYPSYSDTIVITDEELDGKRSLLVLAAHEAVHAFDDALKLSDGTFKDWYHKFRGANEFSSFCEALNERTFLSEGSVGHSQDNEKEFIASLVDSFACIAIDTWCNTISSQSDQFKAKYKEALLELEKQLGRSQSGGNLPSNAPIFEKIRLMLGIL